MFTTTTTQPVEYHGWTLPAGSVLNCEQLVIERYSPVESSSTVRATSPNAAHCHPIAVPTYAVQAPYTELVERLRVREDRHY